MDQAAEIVADGTGFVVRVAGTDQSFVDLDDPLRLEFDYVQRMADVVDALAAEGVPLRFVHVGGAGMTLPRWVATTRPTSAQVVLEPDEALTAAVRERLPLPRRSGIKVRPVDGRAGLAAMRDDHADVVVVDAFVGGQVPAELAESTWFEEVARVLTPDGTALLNLGDTAPFDWTRRVLAGLSQHLPVRLVSAEPSTLKGRRFGNLLVVASRKAVPVDDLRRRSAGSPFPYTVLGPAEVQSRFGGGAVFAAGAGERSPAPPHMRW